MRHLIQSLLVFVIANTLPSADAKYYPPVDRLVLNEIIGGGTGTNAEFPIYLPKRGHYYAEIIREPPHENARTAPIDFNLKIFRHENVVFEKHVHCALPARSNGATLLWLNAPRDLPDRRDLRLALSFNQPLTSSFRLQLTRKLEQFPLFVR